MDLVLVGYFFPNLVLVFWRTHKASRCFNTNQFPFNNRNFCRNFVVPFNETIFIWNQIALSFQSKTSLKCFFSSENLKPTDCLANRFESSSRYCFGSQKIRSVFATVAMVLRDYFSVWSIEDRHFHSPLIREV